MKKITVLMIFAGMFWQSAPTAKEEFSRLLQRAHETRVAGDAASRLQAVLQIKKLLNGAPDIVEASAQAALAAGDTTQALGALGAFAAMGQVDEDILSGKDTNFLWLRAMSRYDTILKQMAMNKTPVSRGAVAFELADPGILAEDIDYDEGTRSFLLTSVMEKKIVRVGPDGKMTDFASSPSHWPMLALKVDLAHRLVWATEVAFRGWNEVPKGDWGRSAVLCYDLRTGILRRRIERVGVVALGDMVLTRRGEPIISDGDGGGIYRVVGDSLERIDRGDFISPQTPVMAPDGKRVLIPDYARGIGIFDLESRQVEWLDQRGHALNGVDGLYYDHGDLLLTQNGSSPERVVRMRMDGGGGIEGGRGIDKGLGVDQRLVRIVSEQIIERATPTLGDPTHGVVVGNSFYYIANSGWDQLDEHGALKIGGKFTPSRIMRFGLR